MTDLLYGLDAAERERVAALCAEGRFFWLDVSLSETSRGDLVDALRIPERAQGALRKARDGFASRAFHADGESVVFALRCYVELEPEKEQDGYRLRPIEVQVLLTSDYLLTLHHTSESRCQRSWRPIFRRDGASDTSSIRCSTQCSPPPPTRSTRSK